MLKDILNKIFFVLILGSAWLLVWIDATDFSTFRALKIILIENAIKIHLYLFFVGSELVLDVSDPMPARTLFHHYQVGHCREPTRTLFVAGSELVRVRVDPEPFYQPTVVVNCILDRLSSLAGVSCNLANCT